MNEARVRTLTAEQCMRLLAARRSVSGALTADAVLHQAASHIASILGVVVAFAGCRAGHWSILARSNGRHDLNALAASGALDDAAIAAQGIWRYTMEDVNWTLVPLKTVWLCG